MFFLPSFSYHFATILRLKRSARISPNCNLIAIVLNLVATAGASDRKGTDASFPERRRHRPPTLGAICGPGGMDSRSVRP